MLFLLVAILRAFIFHECRRRRCVLFRLPYYVFEPNSCATLRWIVVLALGLVVLAHTAVAAAILVHSHFISKLFLHRRTSAPRISPFALDHF